MRNEIEVMRVLRVPPMGQMVLQVGNRRVAKLADIKDERVRRRLLAAIGELIVFAGGYDTLVEADVAPPLPAKAGSRAAVTEETLTAEQEAFLKSLEDELKATIEGKPTRGTTQLNELDARLEYRAPAPQSAPSSLNLVAEIDEILQRHLDADPALRHRTIHLEQPVDGALQIRVDNRYYEHPKEIEEASVRQAIKQALEEWESR